ncbi:MAG: helix-turn-helix domain-containing protein, partial [Alicyclobacillus sp.]
MTPQTSRLKRAVIKEELVALTGNHIDAIILNQFLYWSERVEDFDKFILEERQRYQDRGEELNMELCEGWMYKKAEDLSEETMLGLSKSNMMKHIKALVDAGFIEQRRNPKNKMDKTYQYRVNIGFIQRSLLRLGYSLEGYRVPLDFIVQTADELRSSKTELRSSEIELRDSDSELRSSKTKPRSSIAEQQYQRLLTETTKIDDD